MNVADFKENLPTINKFIYFDKNDYLREKTTNPIKLKQVIDDARNLLKDSNQADQYFLYGIMGNLYRINGQPKNAINCLTYCFNQAIEEKNITREIVSLIRLGEALKYDNKHSKALDHFNKALDMCETDKIDEYLDFVLQHKGKCLMELTKLNDAEKCFVRALELRKTKADFSLINSTQQAIDLVREIRTKGVIN